MIPAELRTHARAFLNPADADIEVFGQARTIAQTSLHRHPALDDPSLRRAELEPYEEAFEHRASA